MNWNKSDEYANSRQTWEKTISGNLNPGYSHRVPQAKDSDPFGSSIIADNKDVPGHIRWREMHSLQEPRPAYIDQSECQMKGRDNDVEKLFISRFMKLNSDEKNGSLASKEFKLLVTSESPLLTKVTKCHFHPLNSLDSSSTRTAHRVDWWAIQVNEHLQTNIFYSIL